MPGPAPAPTALKILKGVRPARINQDEPKPQSHSGVLPPGWGAWMSPGAKRFWKRYAPMLSRLGILTETDPPAFRMTAELWAKWIRLTNIVNKGKLKPADELAYLRILNNIETQMLRYLQQFGMTASSRGRISIGDRPEEEEPDYLD